MFGLLVLLGFSVYFLLTSALPIHEYPRPLNNLFGANNLSSSHAVVTDSLAGDYLTLLSAPFDTTNPNPVDRGYVHDDSDGQYPQKHPPNFLVILETFPSDLYVNRKPSDCI